MRGFFTPNNVVKSAAKNPYDLPAVRRFEDTGAAREEFGLQRGPLGQQLLLKTRSDTGDFRGTDGQRRNFEAV
jgi:hypothetical protein